MSKVSYFNKVTDKKNQIIDFKEAVELVKSCKFQNQIDTLRYDRNKTHKETLKRKLPAITVSGIFKGGHSINDLLEHSGDKDFFHNAYFCFCISVLFPVWPCSINDADIFFRNRKLVQGNPFLLFNNHHLI
jgi:hypothetical protein